MMLLKTLDGEKYIIMDECFSVWVYVCCRDDCEAGLE